MVIASSLHRNVQRRKLSYVLVKVHDECKIEAMVLDILEGPGKKWVPARVSVQRHMASGGGIPPYILLVYCSEFVVVPCDRREVDTCIGTF